MSQLTAELAQTALFTQEKLEPKDRSTVRLEIGILKENQTTETRVALTPDAVKRLCQMGHHVCIEKDAGKTAHYTDLEYAEAGAIVEASRAKVLEAHTLLKIEPFDISELNELKNEKIIISLLHASHVNKGYFQQILDKKHICLNFEGIQDAKDSMPFLRAMSEIAGSCVPAIATEYLNTAIGGLGKILGGITGVPPTEVVFIGAGTVAEKAAKTIIAAGAQVYVFDTDLYKLQRLKKNLPELVNALLIDQSHLEETLKRADVVIAALRNTTTAEHLVPASWVQNMKKDAVIIDLSVDQGGCFETSQPTTHAQPIFKKFDVTHYCVPNVPARAANTASQALSQILTPLLIKAGKIGGLEEMIFTDKGLSRGTYAHKGVITNKAISKKYGFRFKDLELLMAARF